jgi:RNA polymerase sigma-70 factor (ECF subfamily)
MCDDPPNAADTDSDAERMVQVAAGSREAFAELVRRHQNSLLNFFIRMGAYSDAEDLVQETFMRLYRGRERYRPTARFTTFLYVLARHAWADHGRRSWRRDRLESGLESDAAIVDRDRGSGVANRLDVQAALDRLSPKLKEVLVLNVYQGLRYQEIADVLAIPLGTVKSRINLALQELRQQFLPRL